MSENPSPISGHFNSPKHFRSEYTEAYKEMEAADKKHKALETAGYVLENTINEVEADNKDFAEAAHADVVEELRNLREEQIKREDQALETVTSKEDAVTARLYEAQQHYHANRDAYYDAAVKDEHSEGVKINQDPNQLTEQKPPQPAAEADGSLMTPERAQALADLAKPAQIVTSPETEERIYTYTSERQQTLLPAEATETIPTSPEAPQQ